MKYRKVIAINCMLALIMGMMTFVGCGNNTSQATVESNKSGEEIEAPTDVISPETVVQEETGETVNAGATETEAAASEESGEVVAEFEPNHEYDKYALIYYIIEDIDARFVATVSAMDDGTQYEVHCNVDGDEQVVTLDKNLAITNDKTGNLSYDAPIIVQKAIDAGNWTPINNE